MKEVVNFDKIKHIVAVKDIKEIQVTGDNIDITILYDKFDEKTKKRHSEVYEPLQVCKSLKR